MGNQLQVFTNETFGTIRTIQEEERILFCGRDIAAALGYENPGKAVRDHTRQDGGPKRYPIIDTLGRRQEAVFITEGDVYRLIVSSKLPAAQQFERWVFDEVLPTIRRHGVYAIDQLLDDDEFLEQALAHLRTERTKRLIAEQRLAEATPKISYYDIVLQSDSLLSTTEIAKDYGLSAKRLNQILRDEKIQFHRSGRWFLYAGYAQRGYAQSKTHEYAPGKTRTHMYWTQTGRLFIYDLLKNHCEILPVIEREDTED